MEPFDTIAREFKYFSTLRATLRQRGDLSSGIERTIADDLEASVDKHTRNVSIRFNGRLFTYQELEARANQYAHWALSKGLKAGDTVALLMENRPDYIACWFGLSKIGVVVALLNYNLQGKGLAHCIKEADAKGVITGFERQDALISLEGLVDPNLPFWCVGGEAENALSIDEDLASASDTRPSKEYREGRTTDDLCLYVYTSGTTGLPKAARLTNARTLAMLNSFIVVCGITPRDRIYCALPLYHGTGGICGVGQALLSGASLVLKNKFSASQFWEEVIEEKATAFVYIGEMCRYLVSQSPSELDKQHAIRTGFGNGLRPEVWKEFVERFGITQLAEFYGSTEGNVGMISFDGKLGSVGRVPSYMQSKIPVRVLKFDIEAEAPVRGSDGFCIEADFDEAGEVIGEITADSRFDGYSNRDQTEKKVLRDVFKPGDMWFRTGDLMKKDRHGYFYFVDRIGDTFRWKGENVSTNEVAEALSTFESIQLPNVYGVKVPNADGRAGMAAISASGKLDMKALAAHLDKELPYFARPIFLRIQKRADTTGTLKFRKVDLVKQGFGLADSDDRVYVRLPNSAEYIQLTEEIETKINSGEYRF